MSRQAVRLMVNAAGFPQVRAGSSPRVMEFFSLLRGADLAGRNGVDVSLSDPTPGRRQIATKNPAVNFSDFTNALHAAKAT